MLTGLLLLFLCRSCPLLMKKPRRHRVSTEFSSAVWKIPQPIFGNLGFGWSGIYLLGRASNLNSCRSWEVVRLHQNMSITTSRQLGRQLKKRKCIPMQSHSLQFPADGLVIRKLDNQRVNCPISSLIIHSLWLLLIMCISLHFFYINWEPCSDHLELLHST